MARKSGENEEGKVTHWSKISRLKLTFQTAGFLHIIVLTLNKSRQSKGDDSSFSTLSVRVLRQYNVTAYFYLYIHAGIIYTQQQEPEKNAM